jgi:hypothetical protein
VRFSDHCDRAPVVGSRLGLCAVISSAAFFATQTLWALRLFGAVQRKFQPAVILGLIWVCGIAARRPCASRAPLMASACIHAQPRRRCRIPSSTVTTDLVHAAKPFAARQTSTSFGKASVSARPFRRLGSASWGTGMISTRQVHAQRPENCEPGNQQSFRSSNVGGCEFRFGKNLANCKNVRPRSL